MNKKLLIILLIIFLLPITVFSDTKFFISADKQSLNGNNILTSKQIADLAEKLYFPAQMSLMIYLSCSSFSPPLKKEDIEKRVNDNTALLNSLLKQIGKEDIKNVELYSKSADVFIQIAEDLYSLSDKKYSKNINECYSNAKNYAEESIKILDHIKSDPGFKFGLKAKNYYILFLCTKDPALFEKSIANFINYLEQNKNDTEMKYKFLGILINHIGYFNKSKVKFEMIFQPISKILNEVGVSKDNFEDIFIITMIRLMYQIGTYTWQDKNKTIEYFKTIQIDDIDYIKDFEIISKQRHYDLRFKTALIFFKLTNLMQKCLFLEGGDVFLNINKPLECLNNNDVRFLEDSLLFLKNNMENNENINQAVIYQMLALINYMNRNIKDFEMYYQKLIQTGYEAANALSALIYVCTINNDFEKAKAYVNEKISICHEVADDIWLIYIESRLKNYKAAYEKCNDILSNAQILYYNQPENYYLTMLYYAIICARLGDIGSSLKILNFINDLNNSEIQNWEYYHEFIFNKAIVHLADNDYLKAFGYFKVLLKNNTRTDDVSKILKDYYWDAIEETASE